jgi:alpha-amylase
LLRDYVLSDDVAFRFSNRDWPEWPLSAERFAAKLAAADARERYVGLFMDFETFGEHQWEETGILAFLRALPAAALAHSNLAFGTPTEVARELDPVARLSIPRPVSWADAERDLTAWLGNPMQAAAHEGLYALAAAVRAQGDAQLLQDWRRLSTSDHFYYMCTKWFSDGDVHKYFSPYATPHDAFISFMNVLDDLERRVRAPASATPVRALPEAKAVSEPTQAPSPLRKARKSPSPKNAARKRAKSKPSSQNTRHARASDAPRRPPSPAPELASPAPAPTEPRSRGRRRRVEPNASLHACSRSAGKSATRSAGSIPSSRPRRARWSSAWATPTCASARGS